MGKPKDPETKKLIIARQKERKKLIQQKRARLVIRNLPLNTTKQKLLQHFQQFGEVSEVTLLKKPDGSLVGVGFIQFKLVQKARKAQFHTNGKEFMGRKIICEPAMSKDRYEKLMKEDEKESQKVEKGENNLEENVKIKEEPNDEEHNNQNESYNTDDECKIECKPEDDGDDEEVVFNAIPDEVSDIEEEEDEESDDDSESDVEIDKEHIEVKEEVEKPRVISNDIEEGKTVFVKNIPFEATNDDLRECMGQFGPLYYALVCVDKLTEHSKGTGFVKFRNKEDADKCLEAGTELKLFNNILDCHKALSKNELNVKAAEKNDKKHKDTRNLYLIKEGVILAGTKAAEGVSASDMAKRLQLEQYKTQMLRNLNMFISNNRLIIHNLPPSWDDSKLRALFQRHSAPESVIKEARVMRDMRDLDAKGVGRSKEYGFVTFARHEDALQALRSLNNNPNVFTEKRRPIVAFSIENRAVVKMKEKRLVNSRLKNPKARSYNSEFRKKASVEKSSNKRKFSERVDKGFKPKPKGNKFQKVNTEDSEFVGVTARPGVSKMRSRYKLKTQAELHRQHLKQEKKKERFSKKMVIERKQKEPKQPKKKKFLEKDDFGKLVNNYKSMLQNINNKNNAEKKKWYE